MSSRARTANDPLVGIADPQERPDLDSIAAFAVAISRGETCALVTVVAAEGSVPRGMGAAMMVRPDRSIHGTVGGGNLEQLAIGHAIEAMQDGRARRYHYDFTGGPGQNIEKSCKGRCDFFVQPSVRRPRLYVFGAGHVGMALAPMADAAGFAVTVIDDRPNHTPLTELPASIRGLNLPWSEAIDELDFDDDTYVVAVTYGHATDSIVVQACLQKPYRYLGMIGSKAKAAQTRRELGVDDLTREKLSRLHSPIGLGLGGRQPGEVAVSIVAELVAERHRDDGSRRDS